MNSIYFLKAAYAATWIIHLTYITILYRRYRRLRKEIDELKRM
jgi:CcmD family protein